MAFNPIVDKEKCTGCGTCANICPVNVYDMVDGKAVAARAKDCIGCKACEVNCPVKAIVVEEEAEQKAA